eukprot:NODE_14625_length_1097_cov_2.013402.p2 GENE.NODE_14625_length_1097_cov_2.013402~~NODE_14625_length_1097_cov_2.013402.p2  ORF type:complete len:123 (+),score=28.00 NODE_14625_length_1097_cov_2.013402:411-779(+)
MWVRSRSIFAHRVKPRRPRRRCALLRGKHLKQFGVCAPVPPETYILVPQCIGGLLVHTGDGTAVPMEAIAPALQEAGETTVGTGEGTAVPPEANAQVLQDAGEMTPALARRRQGRLTSGQPG